ALPTPPLLPYTTLFRSAPHPPAQSPRAPARCTSGTPACTPQEAQSHPQLLRAAPAAPDALAQYGQQAGPAAANPPSATDAPPPRSEEHTSELQSRENLV